MSGLGEKKFELDRVCVWGPERLGGAFERSVWERCDIRSSMFPAQYDSQMSGESWLKNIASEKSRSNVGQTSVEKKTSNVSGKKMSNVSRKKMSNVSRKKNVKRQWKKNAKHQLKQTSV